MTAQNLTPRTWYLVGAGLIVSAATMVIIAFSSMIDRIEGMQRIVMPGKAEITLPAGRSTLYLERRTILDGARESTALPSQCKVLDPPSATIVGSSTSVEYAIGSYEGRSAFDVEVADAGKVTIECTGQQAGAPFYFAVGRGVGSAIVVGVIGIFPFLVGLVVTLVVFFKRRRQLRARA